MVLWTLAGCWGYENQTQSCLLPVGWGASLLKQGCLLTQWNSHGTVSGRIMELHDHDVGILLLLATRVDCNAEGT